MAVSKTKKRPQERKKKRFWWISRAPMDYSLFFTVLFLSAFGVIMIYSSSYYAAVNTLGQTSTYFLANQGKYILIGLILMLGVSFIDYRIWVSMGIFALAASALLIILLKTPLGDSSLGATRWIKIAGIRFQASEPIKMGMIIFFAYYIHRVGINTRKKVLIAIGIAAVISAAIMIISNNMSTAIIIFGICYVILMVSSKNVKPYVIIIVIGIVVAALGVIVIQMIPVNDSENFRITRIRAWLDPTNPLYAADQALQPAQALYAIGSGGLFGKGLGQSLIKFRLPESYNDFILAIICEELGVFGVAVLMFLFIYLLYRIVCIANEATDTVGKIISIGVFAQVGIQVLLNVMVVISIFPTTGVTLPFISQGGASVIFLLFELGMVLNIDRRSKTIRYKKEARIQAENAMKRKEAAQKGKIV